MTSYYTYFIVEYILPLLLGIIATVAVGVAGSCILNPGKLVRIMFPYISENDDNTVVFGFILTKYDIRILFWSIMLPVVFITMGLFGSVFTEHTFGRHSPYDDADCFYYINNTYIDLNLSEAAVLDEDIECFKWNINLGDALGKATGTLAIAWIIVSFEIWVILNLGHRLKKCVKITPKKPRKCRIYYSCFLMGFIPVCSIMLYIGLSIVALYGVTWLFYLVDPKNFLIIFILLSSMIMFCIPIKKEPKSLDEYCRETMKKRKKPKEPKDKRIAIETDGAIQEYTEGGESGCQIRIDILKEMIELEYKRGLANEAANYIGKDKTREIATNVFDALIQNKKEERNAQTEF
uniref:Uncharacterized protein n=1 Tax=Amphimedon queenslandica TaxID=400682 RepID=A0A1X7UGJ0_AMPQE